MARNQPFPVLDAVGLCVCLLSAVIVSTVPAYAQYAGALTNEKAQQAVQEWLAGNGSASVQDVQEVPAANMAKADVDVSDMAWLSPQNDAVTAYVMGPGGGRHVYSGHLDAIFAHYTDGSWALVRVTGPMGAYENLHVVVQ
ncbi:MAG TPA: hypothetical protein VGT78_01150 [Rhizomicrobium sp.]|nr:hypothetical protein [Rhizomicrobium sp.]